MKTKLFLSLSLVMIGCGGSEPEVPPEISMGFFELTGYRELYGGAECPIIDAVQGGKWTMPALRARGFDNTGEFISIQCTIKAPDRTLISQIDNRARLRDPRRLEDGWTKEIPIVPMPIPGAERYFNTTAILQCTVTEPANAALTATNGEDEILLIPG
jgi:hypothetical protein